MDTPLARKILAVALRALTTIAFLPFVAFKLLQYEMWVERFAAWGYPGWGVVTVTTLEIAGLVGLWAPATAPYAKGLLGVVLLGAAFTWMVNGPPQAMVFPLGLLVLLGLVAWAERMHEAAA